MKSSSISPPNTADRSNLFAPDNKLPSASRTVCHWFVGDVTRAILDYLVSTLLLVVLAVFTGMISVTTADSMEILPLPVREPIERAVTTYVDPQGGDRAVTLVGSPATYRSKRGTVAVEKVQAVEYKPTTSDRVALVNQSRKERVTRQTSVSISSGARAAKLGACPRARNRRILRPSRLRGPRQRKCRLVRRPALPRVLRQLPPNRTVAST